MLQRFYFIGKYEAATLEKNTLKKSFITALLVLSTLFIASCGSNVSTDRHISSVTIAIGSSGTGSASNMYKAAAVPSSLNNGKIVFTISGNDMSTITKEIILSGQTEITETFDIQNGDNRSFKVEAVDSSGNVLYIGEKTGVKLDGNPITLDIAMEYALPSVPSVPTGVSASAGDTQNTVTWSAVTGATSYNIYWSTTTGVTTLNGTKITGATSPYTHTDLTNGTTYYYIVTAANLGGESIASSQVSASPFPPVPSAPTGVSTSAGDTQSTITWSSVTGATSYNIYWSTTTGLTTSNGTKITGAASPYTHTGLTNGTTYYYIVTAANLGGESVASSQVSASPLPPIPSAPTGVSATAGDTQATISWSAVTGATSYNIYWSTTTGVTTSNGTKISGAASPYTHTGLTNGTTYYYIVTAMNASGESPASAEATATPVAAVSTTRVSLDSAGIQTNNWSDSPSISSDGRYVAFYSWATNLVAGDTNAASDVFVRDTVANTTTRVSVDSAGAQGNSNSYAPSISSDGRYVAFQSVATNLVAGDTNSSDIFVRDTVANTTIRVSVDSAGAQGNDWSSAPSISSDGRYVAFDSQATNLVAGDTNGARDTFVRDTVANTTIRVSVDSAGAQGNSNSTGSSISSDGRYVAWSSLATNLVAGDTNGAYDTFVRDTVAGTTTRVSVDSAGVQGNADSLSPSISSDGRYVAFRANASNLVAGDTNGAVDIFVRDTVANTTIRVSVDSAGAQGNNWSYAPFISSDGRYVAFYSNASNLVAADTNSATDMFVRDTVANTTIRVSVDSAGAQGNAPSWSDNPSISSDGRYVAFSSDASNLVAGDTNNRTDIFVRKQW